MATNAKTTANANEYVCPAAPMDEQGRKRHWYIVTREHEADSNPPVYYHLHEVKRCQWCAKTVNIQCGRCNLKAGLTYTGQKVRRWTS